MLQAMLKQPLRASAYWWKLIWNKFFWNAEREADLIIHRLRKFKSTPDFPSPSYLPGGQEYDDIAGVIAGCKPAAAIAIFDSDRVLRNPILFVMIHRAKKMGFTFRSTNKNCLIVGKRDNVLSIYELMKSTKLYGKKNIPQLMVHCTKMGLFLGYSKEAIEDMNYGLLHDLNYNQRERRRNKLRKAS